MKNKKLIIIIILLIILGSIYPIYYIIKKNQKIENKIYYYELKNNSLTLLANGKIVNFYNCDNECTVYENYFDNGKILLQENNKIYLYDLVKGSKLSSDYENVYFICIVFLFLWNILYCVYVKCVIHNAKFYFWKFKYSIFRSKCCI